MHVTRHTKRRRRVIWEEWSLTAKLLTIMMTLMLVVLTGTSAWVLENLRSSLIERTDVQLIQASEALAIQAAETVLTPSPLASPEDRSPTEDSLRQLLPGTYYVQFYDSEGGEVYSPVAPIDGNEPQLPVIDEQTVSTMHGAPFTTDGSESQWRVRALRVENSQLLVAIAVPFDQDIDAVGERARNTVLGIGMLALALVAGVGYFAITNTFRPLHDIENTASKIAAGDLSQRVSTYPSNTELGRLSAALNTMLGHIEDSFDGRKQSEKRIRQFVSDASHELRTPLVTIRGYAELYRQGAITDPDQVGQAMERMESEAKRMTVLVEDLVQLARLDERRPTEIGPVDMTRLVRDGAADALAQAPDRDISFIGLDGEDAQQTPMILGSEARLRQVIVNLAGNAVRHTTEGTEIEFAVGVVDVPAPASDAAGAGGRTASGGTEERAARPELPAPHHPVGSEALRRGTLPRRVPAAGRPLARPVREAGTDGSARTPDDTIERAPARRGHRPGVGAARRRTVAGDPDQRPSRIRTRSSRARWNWARTCPDSPMVASGSNCATTARASPPTRSRGSSSGSTGSTPPADATRADPAWGCRSSRRSSTPTPVRYPSTPPPAAARHSASTCRSPALTRSADRPAGPLLRPHPERTSHESANGPHAPLRPA